MGERMSTNFAFQPESVEVLAMAFHTSLRFILNDPCFAGQNPALRQRQLAMCLMQLVANGEHDPLRLANAAIYRMRCEYGPKAMRRTIMPVRDLTTLMSD